MSAKNINTTETIRQELKELTKSIDSMMEAFRKIHQPIQESSAKLPTTAHQLERVTQQAELATHKVLDMVEAITNRESEINGWLSEVRELIPAEAFSSSDNLDLLLNNIKKHSENNLNDSYSIMDALQFQDITAQQIDYAVSMLDDVEIKLISMLKLVGVSEESIGMRPVRRKRAFDPNASFETDNPTQQQEIDNIISKMD